MHKIFRVILGLGTIFGFLIRSVAVQAEVLCRQTEMATLGSNPLCAASFAVGEGRRLCLSDELWRKSLSQSSIGLPLCSHWEGKWVVHAAPYNGGEHERPKQESWTLVAAQLPVASKSTTAAIEGSESARAGILSRAISAAAPVPRQLIAQIEKLRQRVVDAYGGSDQTGLLRSLLVGRQASGSLTDWMRLLGFVHLFMATGIHLYVLARATDRATYSVWRAIGGSAYTGVPVSRCLSALSWITFWLLGGMRLGMFRPLLLLGAREGSQALGWRWPPWAPLLWATIGESALAWSRGQPWTGHWTYALIVGGGLAAQAGVPNPSSSPWRAHVALALGSWLPWATWEALGGLGGNHPFAPWTPVISLITLAIFPVWVFPAAGLAVLYPGSVGAEWLHWIGHASDIFVWSAMQATESVGGLWTLNQAAAGAGAILAFAWICTHGLRAKREMRLIILAMLLGGRFAWAERPVNARSSLPLRAESVEQLDIGQGDAALVRYRGAGGWSAGMIDTGPRTALSPGAWVRWAAARGLTRLEWIALTHLDADHATGVLRLASLIPIGCVATGLAERNSERGIRLAAELAERGIRFSDWSTPCVPFTTLGPPLSVRGAGNANMSAIWIPLVDDRVYLSMGDADAAQEQRFVAWASSLRKAQPDRGLILKISHHGSRFSTDPQTLERLQPAEAWISAGLGNHYGHPARQTLRRLGERQIEVRRTDLEGGLMSVSRRKSAGAN